MAQSLRKRFAGREEEIRKEVLLKGMLPVFRELGVRYGFEKYTKDILGIENPKYVTRNTTSTPEELAYTLVGAIYQMYKKMDEEIASLKAENERIRDYEEKKKAIAKGQLMELLEAREKWVAN